MGKEHEQAVLKKRTFKWPADELKPWGTYRRVRAWEWNDDYLPEATEPLERDTALLHSCAWDILKFNYVKWSFIIVGYLLLLYLNVT